MKVYAVKRQISTFCTALALYGPNHRTGPNFGLNEPHGSVRDLYLRIKGKIEQSYG
ncbi:predicted protein [Histoplasma mississippiense (nom. inval.)]|uniref:predicted protein n=1 Tax=Ajellomyces capsulatus (strain NAm1 / WU24) TaxID=2059318 RepID=UPI000157BE31|nr:predicted protein [Histoplasma mississippiense (nom. inval.)]EDN06695.1 predicted protein [Histoplasma mississippiense (nom. inval.)]